MKNREFQDIAQAAYTKAVKLGLLVRPDRCSRCGAVGDVHGHHADYARPFNVDWVCRKCHGGAHATTEYVRAGIIRNRPKRRSPDTATCYACNGTGASVAPKPLTAVQRELYEFVWSHTQDRGYAPSFEEICAVRGYASLATVHEHMENLERKGYVARRFNRARGITCLVDISAAALVPSNEAEEAA